MQYRIEHSAPQPSERGPFLTAVNEVQMNVNARNGEGRLSRRSCLMLATIIALVPNLVYGQDLTMQPASNPVVRKDSDVVRVGDDQYLIGVGDVLDIRIFNRPLLSRDAVRVDGRKMIRLPLIGEVRAGCMTESALAQSISQHYLEYLKNPNVEVFIKDYQS